MTKFTDRQLRFIDAFCGVAMGNASQAAKIAGYTERNAGRMGNMVRAKPHVAAEIARRQSERAAEAGITQQRVLTELEALAFSDVTHYVVSDTGQVQLAEGAPVTAMRAVSSIKHKITELGHGEGKRIEREVEIKLWDKPGPLKLAGQHVGLFPNKVQHSGAIDLRGRSREALLQRVAELAAKA